MYLLFCVAFFGDSFALDKKQILDLLEQPHSRKGISKELEIFPEDRKFKVAYKITYPPNLKNPKSVVANERTVGGKYIVTDLLMENEIRLIVVNSYDKKNLCYRRWVLVDDSKTPIIESIGVRFGNAVSWRQIVESEKGSFRLYIEEFSESDHSWVESYYKDGKIDFSLTGVAKAVE